MPDRTWLRRLFGLASALMLSASTQPIAQTRYVVGQDVVPVFEGWERNADGSFNMVYGYMNRNYEEPLDIPVGPNNGFEPGPADQGQPTHFYNRRQQFVFKIRVPKDWGKKDLVWTLVSRGKTEKAFGSLWPVWQLDTGVYQENRGGAGELGDEDEPPTAKLLGSATRTASVLEKLPLTVEVTDDGLPPPRKGRAAAAPVRDSDGAIISAGRGAATAPAGPRRESPLTQAVVKLDPGVALGVVWIVYRGDASQVSFDQAKVAVKEGRASTSVQFSAPGTYVLRGYADDTIYPVPVDVTVSVAANTAMRPAQPPAAAPAPAPSLDYDFFKARVEPIFLATRGEHARCVTCHGPPLGLVRLPKGVTGWTDEESRKNFDAVKRYVRPGDPLSSRLLTHPLASSAGGDAFHTGGKHWTSQTDPEWQVIAAWVNGQTLAAPQR